MVRLRNIIIGDNREISSACLQVSYCKASGPGGQHVNKTESRVDLRLDLQASSEYLSKEEMNQLKEKLSNRIDADGCLFVQNSEHREQARNLEGALVRLEELVSAAIKKKKKRIPTKATKASKERRLNTKRNRSDVKRGRRGEDW